MQLIVGNEITDLEGFPKPDRMQNDKNIYDHKESIEMVFSFLHDIILRPSKEYSKKELARELYQRYSRQLLENGIVEESRLLFDDVLFKVRLGWGHILHHYISEQNEVLNITIKKSDVSQSFIIPFKDINDSFTVNIPPHILAILEMQIGDVITVGYRLMNN